MIVNQSWLAKWSQIAYEKQLINVGVEDIKMIKQILQIITSSHNNLSATYNKNKINWLLQSFLWIYVTKQNCAVNQFQTVKCDVMHSHTHWWLIPEMKGVSPKTCDRLFHKHYVFTPLTPPPQWLNNLWFCTNPPFRTIHCGITAPPPADLGSLWFSWPVLHPLATVGTLLCSQPAYNFSQYFINFTSFY